MTTTHSKATDGKTNDSLLKLNYSSSGQSVTQVNKESMALISNGLLPIAAWETSASQLEPSTPASSDYGVEDLLPPLKVTQLQEEQNDSITISPRMEKQSLAIQTLSSQGSQIGLQNERQPNPAPSTALGDEPFFTKQFSSPLSVLLGEEEQNKVIGRATQLSEWQKQGRSKAFVLFWDGIYLLDLLLRYAASRVEAFTSVIKLIDIKIK